jgi:hypothetical protein
MPPIVKSAWRKFLENAETVIFATLLTVIIGLLSAQLSTSIERAKSDQKVCDFMERVEHRTTELETSEHRQDKLIVNLHTKLYPNYAQDYDGD